MELRALQYFLTVAREENITRAAELPELAEKTRWEIGTGDGALTGVVSIGAAEGSAAQVLPE